MGKYEPAPTTAAGIVRLARAKAKLTQAELAERCGIDQQVVSAYETGRRQPTLPTLEKLAGAAGFELSIRLLPHDDHDAALAAYVDQLPPELRSEVERRQRDRVASAQRRRVRGK